jgi:hypothetical protein
VLVKGYGKGYDCYTTTSSHIGTLFHGVGSVILCVMSLSCYCLFCRELSGLRNGTENRTSSFSEVKRCICVQGAYPEKLIGLWNDYNDDKGKLQVTYLMC